MIRFIFCRFQFIVAKTFSVYLSVNCVSNIVFYFIKNFIVFLRYLFSEMYDYNV